MFFEDYLEQGEDEGIYIFRTIEAILEHLTNIDRDQIHDLLGIQQL